VENAIKGLFYAYKHLPVGVMLFKKRTLFFINDHLQNVLLLSALSKERIIEIIGNRLGIPNPSHYTVHDFLFNNSYFLNQNSIIQIERRSISDDITIFVLVKISEQSIEAIKNSSQPLPNLLQKKHESSPLNNSEWKLLTNALGTNFEDKKIISIVLYKGIPLKAESKIISISNEMIEISIEKNQLIATETGKEWLLGIKQDLMIAGDLSSYDLKGGRIWLKNLRLVSEGFHLRNNIRYAIEKIGHLNILSKNENTISLPLYDLSEKGVSVQTDDPTVLVTISSKIGKPLDAQIIVDDLNLSVEAIPLYIETMDIPGMMKVAFSIVYDSHNETLLHNWMNNEQHSVIKKVRHFVQMISGEKPDILNR